jgi:hypothetical protein
VAVAWRCQHIQFVGEFFGSACYGETNISFEVMKETHEEFWTGQRGSLVCGRASPIVLSTKCNFGLLTI